MTITIDDQRATLREGETILACALRNGIHIPHLCTHPSLPAFGACRMCLVEVEGLRGRAAACTTPAADGMVVHTNTPALKVLRKSILELLLLEHPSACIVCGKQELCDRYRPAPQKAGRTTGCHTCNNKDTCELRDLCEELGIERLPVAPFYRDLSIERWDPFMDRDLNLCILCGRCVRICKEHHGTATIDFIHRGSRARIGEAFGRTLLEAGCRFCGSCVDVCPTGSLADRYAKWHRPGGDPVETTCTYCPEACPVRVSVDKHKAVSVRTARDAMPICVLGRFAGPAFLNSPDRLRMARVRVGDVLRETSWEEAAAAAAGKLQPYRDGRFAFICDTTSALEDRAVFERFTRQVMGSPHYLEIEPDGLGRASVQLPAGIRAACATGRFIGPETFEQLELLILMDSHPTDLSERAHFVFPAAVLVELQGTWRDAAGALRPLAQAVPPPGEARQDWELVCQLAGLLGADGFGFGSIQDLTDTLGVGAVALRLDLAAAPPAASDPRRRRTHYRGHEIAARVHGLRSLPPAAGAAPPARVEEPAQT